MKIVQKNLVLQQKPRGFHIITLDVAQGLGNMNITTGILQVFIQHTSASLSINENADPTVRKDFETFFNRTVPENASGYKHTYEGPDDITAHIKASLLGSSVMVPIQNGKLALGTWQSIYLCEHRNEGGKRSLVLTAWGE